MDEDPIHDQTYAFAPNDPRSVGDLTFFADFENASDDFRVSYEPEDGAYEVAPYSWMHFGVDGVAGKRPTFRVDHPDHVDERRKFVWSPDGREWSYFEDITIDADRYAFATAEPFETDRVFVAGLFPYRLCDLEELRYNLRDSPYVSGLAPRGYSPDRRPIHGLAITDPDVPAAEKHNVVVMAGQHAWEAWGRQVCHGFLEAVASDDTVARRLRRKAVVHAYPIANPDGVTRGHMRDGTVDHNPNRAWIAGAPPEAERSPVPEVDVLRRAILEDTGGEATYFLDFHSHAGWYDRFMWYADGDDPAVSDLVEAIHRADGERHGDAIVGTETVGGAPNPERKTSKRWAEATLGATGLTFEATPYGSPSMERYRRAGGAFVAGLEAVLE
ncbi:M14 family zinc carboxypeptidase [Halomontanus rarus]|uniref:M14 family zinc carboxypeptidase n=1 Tax=Halomontanus rarus TaxID=3034020 RepID=UPI001A99407B